AACFALNAIGAPVGAKTAAVAVKGWLQLQKDHRPLGTALGGTVANVETYNDKTGSPLYHVVYLEPSGFVIVSAEGETEPVIAWVEKGHFDPSTSNPLGALVSRDLPIRVAYARAHAGSASGAKHLSNWQTLAKSATGVIPKSLGSVSDIRVAPFIKTA